MGVKALFYSLLDLLPPRIVSGVSYMLKKYLLDVQVYTTYTKDHCSIIKIQNQTI